ncbi:MAG: winged helix-turn-helix transcriptional regulator [Gemmobacter sp.]
MTTLPYDAARCPVERTVALLSGKWRLMVLFRLGAGPVRFNALARSLAPISQRVLTETLRGLEADGLVWRAVRATVPPHVDYGLTERGLALTPVFEALAAWGAGDVSRLHPPPRSRSGTGHAGPEA